ncbi:nuclear transport factor 2 family protein [Roseomonas sp. WA12]
MSLTPWMSWRMMARRRLPAALALALAAAPLAASAAPAEAPMLMRNEEIVRRAFDGWAAGRSAFTELLSPDVVWTIHGSGPVAGTYRSRADFIERASRPLINRLATPLVPKVHHIWATGDTVIIRFEASATTNSGAAYTNQFVWIFRMRDGSVVEAEAFLDLVAYQRAVEGSEPRRP